MEVIVQRVEGAPGGSQIGIRAGHARKQVVAESQKVMRFPWEVSDCGKLQVEFLAVLGRASIALEPDKELYSFEIEPSGACQGIKADVKVRRTAIEPPPTHGPQAAPPPSNRRPQQAVAANLYMEKHGLMEAVQKAITTTVEQRPEDPVMYLSRLLAESAAEQRTPSKAGLDTTGDTQCPTDGEVNRSTMSTPSVMTSRFGTTREARTPSRFDDQDEQFPSAASTEADDAAASRTVPSPEQETSSENVEMLGDVECIQNETISCEPLNALRQVPRSMYEAASTASLGSLSCAEVSICLDHENEAKEGLRPSNRRKDQAVLRMPLLGPALAAAADYEQTGITCVDTLAESDAVARQVLQSHSFQLVNFALPGQEARPLAGSIGDDDDDARTAAMSDNVHQDSEADFRQIASDVRMKMSESVQPDMAARMQPPGGSASASMASIVSEAGAEEVQVRLSLQAALKAEADAETRRRRHCAEASNAPAGASEPSRSGGDDVQLDTHPPRPPLAPRPAQRRHSRASSGDASTVSVQSVRTGDDDETRSSASAIRAVARQSTEQLRSQLDKAIRPPDHLRRHPRATSSVSDITMHQFFDELEPISEYVALAHRDIAGQSLKEILGGFSKQLADARIASSLAEQRVRDRLSHVTAYHK
mmetsp:Transcript_36587/g.105176  ORF Transcript_36587/g.105176 Transcript_36587/m.105176 type:complete len:650 (+) Transcript_36587:101-2050(+)